MKTREQMAWGVLALVLLPVVVGGIHHVALDPLFGAAPAQSGGSAAADYRDLVVAMPTVRPAGMPIGDDLQLRVTDAWVQSPERNAISALLAGDRGKKILTIKLAVIPQDPTSWYDYPPIDPETVEVFLNGHAAHLGQSTRLLIASVTSPEAFPDTLEWTFRRK